MSGLQQESHSTPGVPARQTAWYLAEGDNSFFATYYAVVNPSATASTVRFRYLHENGLTFPPRGRAVSGQRPRCGADLDEA